MKEFVSHIDYLIQKHDCVIIPDFGGFVLSHEGASFMKDGSVLPPKITIGFNSQLKSNDGLLAESYMTMYSIPYDEACKRINEAVTRLNTILGMRHPVQMARLGKLFLDENGSLSFEPNDNLSVFHPETFGLGTVNLRRLSYIEEETTKVKRTVYLKRALVGVGAAAAAIIMFFVASTPVPQNVTTQKSSFFTDLIPSVTERVDASENVEVKKETSSVSVREIEVDPVVSKVENMPETGIGKYKANAVGDRNYFVIVGGATSGNEANNLMEKFREQGLEVSAIKSRLRIRIYVASFSTREAAEDYLVSFKHSHPDMKDAWVHFQE